MTDDAPENRPGKNPVTVQDLLRLHRYARSRFMDGFRSKNSLARSEGVKADAITHSWSRIEAEFGIYVLTRRATGSVSEKDDLQSESDVADFLQQDEADRQKKLAEQKEGAAGGSENISEGTEGKRDVPLVPKVPTIESRHSLTLTGEIFGEVASILAGYLTIAKLATKQNANGHHNHSSDLLKVLGWLQLERRRLHRAVTDARASDTAVFEMGVQDIEEHFSPEGRAKSDVLDMATCPIEDGHSTGCDLGPAVLDETLLSRVFTKPEKSTAVLRRPVGGIRPYRQVPAQPDDEDQATPPPSSQS